ncbi:hypothetical protein DTO013E5_1265 [Penicillium roqueforti]|nr:hypothetical protein DTO012A1_18 [Penicillium roqueforti]KAI2751041.1 hypothetical protein DTO013F2_4292 [Penicillium roqueforti]KAI2775103.1 hypothetical protein DTO012A8_588 [Penicillium roqueforti]KAI3083735.1 hypothetical protein CBS147339_2111 [Penicillium roqueforti]KAI3096760.1 hypothetical protein CBS147338_5175 [Penicillium roqueforti]
MHLNDTPGSKLHSLNRLLPTPNRRPGNSPLLANHRRRERRRNSLRVMFRNAHADQRTIETQQRQRLRIRRIHSRTDNRRVSAQSICQRMNVLRQRGPIIVPRELRDIHEMLCPRFLDESLFAAVVDADYAQAYSPARELYCEVA